MKSPFGQSDGLPHTSVATVELEQALARPGCVVCALTHRMEKRWVWTLLYEHSGDISIHQALADAVGLCAEHGALVERVVGERQLASAGATARLYLTVVNRVRDRLQEGGRRVPVPRCPLCLRVEQTGRHLAGTLAQALKDGAWREGYESSDGLCLPHLDMCLSAMRGEVRDWLREDANRRLDELSERLSEFCRKQRYDVEEEISEEESVAWKEALWRIGGLA
ncbi:MAG: hypothetical protein R6U88_01970 [Candidatus Bipolaricaulota bacterium]